MSMISDASGVTDKEETNTLITSTFHIVTFVYYLLVVVHAIKCQLIHPLNKRKGRLSRTMSLSLSPSNRLPGTSPRG
jgi:predicted PurR-regulated permease PerM